MSDHELQLLEKNVTCRPAALYRHFNKSGELLYIGISVSALVRLTKHRNSSSWFHEIYTVTIEHFTSRKEALSAETKAIAEEKPKHNLKKVGPHRRLLKNWPFGNSWVPGSVFINGTWIEP